MTRVRWFVAVAVLALVVGASTPWAQQPYQSLDYYALTSAVPVTASTNATSVKAGPGAVYGYVLTNKNATIYYLRMYNLAAPPTCSSATGFVAPFMIPANTSGAGMVVQFPLAQGFTTGIAYCITGGDTSTDNTNAATGVNVVVLYK